MTIRRRNDAGFGAIEGLIAVAAVLVVSTVGVVVYQHQHKTSIDKNTAANGSTSNQQTIASTTQPAPPEQTAESPTHTSAAGGFTFTYPSAWKVSEGAIGSDDEIVIDSPNPSNQPTSGRVTRTDALTMTMWVTSNPDSAYQPSAVPNGTVQKLSNGVSLWTSSSAHSPTASGATDSCPVMELLNADSTHFSYALSNGKYLTLEAGYCEGQGSQVTQSYQQQLASADWQTAVALVDSMKFQ